MLKATKRFWCTFKVARIRLAYKCLLLANAVCTVDNIYSRAHVFFKLHTSALFNESEITNAYTE